jgi:hypothetical protein
MKTVTVLIGNSDNKLTQDEWADFVNHIESIINAFNEEMFFSGGSSTRERWQNYGFVFSIEEKLIGQLVSKLSKRRAEYKQDSVAWVQGETKFI